PSDPSAAPEFSPRGHARSRLYEIKTGDRLPDVLFDGELVGPGEKKADTDLRTDNRRVARQEMTGRNVVECAADFTRPVEQQKQQIARMATSADDLTRPRASGDLLLVVHDDFSKRRRPGGEFLPQSLDLDLPPREPLGIETRVFPEISGLRVSN